MSSMEAKFVILFSLLGYHLCLQFSQEHHYVTRNDSTNKETTYQVCFPLPWCHCHPDVGNVEKNIVRNI